MKQLLVLIPLLVAAALVPPTATAAISHNFAATLSGSQEVPAVTSTGKGLFTAALSADMTVLTFTESVSGIDPPSRITASHIHVGPVGVNGPIILFLFNRATEGTFVSPKTGTLTAANLIPRPAQGINNFADAINVMLAGGAYVNVHTDQNPGGEIRGQISPGVAIDVKPGSDPNSINVMSVGVIPVSVLTTPTFDANTVDPSTVRFGRTGTEASSVQSALEDVDMDGDMDLVLHFNTQETGIRAGDTQASLTGMTLSGMSFAGSDAVRAFFPGDVNGDFSVNIIDLALVGAAYGSSLDSERWNPYADFDGSGIINIVDLATAGAYFGQHA